MRQSIAPDLKYGARLGDGRSSEVFAEGADRVLKLYRFPWEETAIATELAATVLAHEFGLPVPQPHGIVDSGDRRGIVFQRIRGQTMLRHYGRNPVGLLLALRRMAHLQRSIHACDGSRLPAVEATLRHQIAAARVSDPVRHAALARLGGLPGGTRLCHGDLHPGNVISTRSGSYVVDWQKAGAGAPAMDAARTALLLRHGRLSLGRLAGVAATDAVRRFITGFYLRHYVRLSGISAAEIEAWRLPVLVSRLFGQAAPNEADLRAEAERLARPADAG